MIDVLIVDDERSVLELLTDVLTDEGFSVATALDGQAALDLLDDGMRPLLVVADLMMPRLSGVELAAALRARYGGHTPPVVVMSANQRWLDDLEGVSAKLPKPFALDTLVHLVGGFCQDGRRRWLGASSSSRTPSLHPLNLG